MKKRLRHVTLHVIMLLIACNLWAQQKSITGKIIDAQSKPIEGASIIVKGKTNATASDAFGNFKINANNSDVLLITSIGFVSVEQKIGSNTSLNIILTSTASSLSEVVVVGYGTTRKKDVTGAVSTITAKEFQKGAISTPEQMIAGKVPGVSIISNGGQPGSGSTIRIRGGASLRASNDPLIVIDGVPLENGGVSGAGNALSFINPNDIESFTILKDASAAAIYGTRASNGVIIITTKRGLGGKLKTTFSSTNSRSQITQKVDVLSADELRNIVNTKGTAAQKAMLGTANTDWQDEIYQSAFATDNNISFSGGIKKLPYRVSIGYMNQDGVLKTDNLQRASAAIIINPTFFNNHLKVDLNLKASMQNTRFANTAAIGGAISFNPTQPVYATVKKERFAGYFEWLDASTATGLVNLVGRNPVGLLHQRMDKSNPVRSIGNLQLDYKFHFLPELHANVNIGYDVSNGSGTVFVSDSAASDYIAGGIGGQNNKYKQTRANTIFDFYLNYVKELKLLNSRIDVTAGYSYNNFLTTAFNYASYNAQGVKYPNSDPTFAENKPENTLISVFARANYNFKDRYLLTATIRRDGSSRFGPENRWGVFPSLALAWKVKDETFLKNTKAISDLKIRLGYGITGQQDGIGNYDYLSYYSLSNTNATYQFGNSYYVGFRPSGYYPARKWEQTATTNFAVDYGFLNNRITGSIDFYYKKTSDLLNLVAQPVGTNFSAFITANVGDMENKGVEFSINTQPLRIQNLTWDLGFNITYNKNTITNLTVIPQDRNYPGIQTGGISGGIGGGFAQINAVGFGKNTFNLYRQVYNANGKPIENVFVDVNEDGVINQDDLVKSKSANPDVFLGLSSSVSYKKWSAGFVMRASLGNYVYNNVYSNNGQLSQVLGNSVVYNASASYLETNFIGNSNNLLSDYFMQNASFLRMDNINVGYNAGKILKNTATLRLNASIQNVFIVSKYKGLDPEVSSGVDNSLYPRPRIFSLGIGLDF